MAGDLRTIFSSVEAALLAVQPYVRVYVGASHVREEGSPPRVVFVPRGESIIPGTDGRSGESTSPGLTRVVAVRVVDVEAHIWGAKLDGSGKASPAATEMEHLDAAEQLVSDVIVAAHRTTWGYQVRPVRGEWESETGGLLKLGFQYVLHFEWRIGVVLTETTGTVRLVTVSHTP